MRPNILKIIGAALIGGYFLAAALDPMTGRIIDGANLIFHEAGHTLFLIFPMWLEVAGGSITQVAIPVIIAGTFFFRRDLFAGGLILTWAGQSIVNVSVYAGDALVMQLELIGGKDTLHDWNHLLWHFGLLRHTDLIASMLRWSGISVAVIGMVLALIATVERIHEPTMADVEKSKKRRAASLPGTDG